MTTIIIAASQTFYRPVDWNDSANSVQLIGGGAGGLSFANGAHGGGGGAFAKSLNVVIPASVSVSIGAGGTPDAVGGATSFGGLVVAAGGNILYGGNFTSCLYNAVAFNGGNGGTFSGGTRNAGCGGGGAAGPGGNGGGGASDNGFIGGNGGYSPSVAGGVGGNGSVGANGNNGVDFNASYGSGSGGGGGAAVAIGGTGFNGGHGGFYGGGGGGGGYGTNGKGSGGYGRSGLAVITYTPLVPLINSVVPATGSTLGGTSVTINGAGFISVSSVTIGGVSATSISVVNANTITCVTPAHAQGLVSVVVTGINGVGSAANAFRYVTFAFPKAGNLVFTRTSPEISIETDTTGQIRFSSSKPIIENTTHRNITPDSYLLSLSSAKPSIRQTHDLVLSSDAPIMVVTTEPIPMTIYDDDSLDEVIVVYLDEPALE